MNGYAPINVYRGLWRHNGSQWERATWRPGHTISVVLPDYLHTYDARTEYPELTQNLGAPYWAGLWFWTGQAWQQHRTWNSWNDTGAPYDSHAPGAIEGAVKPDRGYDFAPLFALAIGAAFLLDYSRGKTR